MLCISLKSTLMFQKALAFVKKTVIYFNIGVNMGPIAQLEEPPAHNRSVPGSSPGGPTIGLH
jgi:hypothetical protein